jgi:hypothetical protein
MKVTPCDSIPTMPVTTWSTEVTYRSLEGDPKTARVYHKTKVDARKHFLRMSRNPAQVMEVKLYYWNGRDHLVATHQGYIFNDDIPF